MVLYVTVALFINIFLFMLLTCVHVMCIMRAMPVFPVLLETFINLC